MNSGRFRWVCARRSRARATLVLEWASTATVRTSRRGARDRRITDFTSRRDAMPNAPESSAFSIRANSIEGTRARSVSPRRSLSAQRNGGSRMRRGFSGSGRLRSPTTYGRAFRYETHETFRGVGGGGCGKHVGEEGGQERELGGRKKSILVSEALRALKI